MFNQLLLDLTAARMIQIWLHPQKENIDYYLLQSIYYLTAYHEQICSAEQQQIDRHTNTETSRSVCKKSGREQRSSVTVDWLHLCRLTEYYDLILNLYGRLNRHYSRLDRHYRILMNRMVDKSDLNKLLARQLEYLK